MGQVRGSLLLEAVAKKEKIEITPADFDVELKKNAEQMKADETKLREFYNEESGSLRRLRVQTETRPYGQILVGQR